MFGRTDPGNGTKTQPPKVALTAGRAQLLINGKQAAMLVDLLTQATVKIEAAGEAIDLLEQVKAAAHALAGV